MNIFCRNSISIYLASFVSALLLTILMFLIFPFSRKLSLQKVESLPNVNTKTFVQLTPKSLEISSKKDNLKDMRISNIKSFNYEKIKIEIPTSDFAKFQVVSREDASLFNLTEFAMENSDVNTANFDLKIFEISELDFIPRCIKKGVLQYPRRLFEKGIEGEVRLMVFINKDGSVELDNVQSYTHEDFLASAKKALKDFLYEIPTLNGEPVKAHFVLPITFKITNR